MNNTCNGVMLSFLELNGVRVDFTDNEIIDIGMKLANSEMTYEELLTVLRKHITKE